MCLYVRGGRDGRKRGPLCSIPQELTMGLLQEQSALVTKDEEKNPSEGNVTDNKMG